MVGRHGGRNVKWLVTLHPEAESTQEVGPGYETPRPGLHFLKVSAAEDQLLEQVSPCWRVSRSNRKDSRTSWVPRFLRMARIRSRVRWPEPYNVFSSCSFLFPNSSSQTLLTLTHSASSEPELQAQVALALREAGTLSEALKRVEPGTCFFPVFRFRVII